MTGAPRRKPRPSCWRPMPITAAADPTKPHANPTPLKAVPKFDFAAMDQAVAALKKSAAAFDAALAAKGAQAIRPKTAPS